MPKKTARKTTRKKAPARKAAARKRPARKTTARKSAARKTTRAAKPAAPQRAGRITAAAKARTKTEIFGTIAEQTGLARKQVAEVFETMREMMGKDLGRRGPGEFNVPGLMKVRVQTKPATRGGIRPNPFKPGEMMKVKPKPARRIVKVRPLKGLKELV